MFTILTIVLTELYLSHIGLGDPVRYDSDYIYGYAPKENQKKERINGATVTINDRGVRSVINWKDDSKTILCKPSAPPLGYKSSLLAC